LPDLITVRSDIFRRMIPVAFVALVLVLPTQALAWGKTGHRAVGRIAEHHLSDVAAAEIAALLGHEGLAHTANWPDTMRADPSFRVFTNWHWVTIADGETYEGQPPQSQEEVGDIIAALRWNRDVARDRSAPLAKRQAALKWIAHLVGDIHQPLHVGRPGDRGGNDVKVEWHRQPTNLHHVWDTDIIEKERLSFSELAELLDHATADEIRAWQSASILDWAAESMAHRQAVYEIGDGELSYGYHFVHWPFVKERLLQAGIRLAGFINEIFTATSPTAAPQ
jgi:hypothetical protein